MSGRREKALRKLYRAEQGLSKEFERGQREFEADVARLRMRRAVAADQPIVRRDGRRRALAIVGLVILAALLLAIAAGAR